MSDENIFTICQLTETSYIAVNFYGAIDHMISGRKVGRKFKNRERAIAYLDAHPNAKAKFDAWLKVREDAIRDILKSTDHYEYYSDGGNLAIRINGSAILRVGNGGDGRHRVYVAKSANAAFSFTGISICDCTIEPLDYDCEGGKPLFNMSVKSVTIYRREDNILLVVE